MFTDSIELNTFIAHELKKAIKSGKTPAFCYDRVSSERQGREGLSLAYQQEGADLYAVSAGLYIIHKFTITESAFRSGTRKVFKQMLDAAARFDIKDIIFQNTDRMCRNYADWLLLDKIIADKNINIHFYQTGRIINQKSSYIENYIMDIEIADAKKHSKKISHDVQQINKFKAARGIAPSRSPDGYKYDKSQRRHVVDPNRKMIIQYIFDKFDNSNISVRQLSQDLNNKGWKTSSGKSWRHPHLHYILSNQFYSGTFMHQGKKFDGNQDIYIDPERFKKRMTCLGLKYRGSRKRNYDFNLAGILTCDDKKLTGEIKKGRYVYYTNRYINKSIREEEIFEWIDREIQAVQYSPHFAEELKRLFSDTITHQKNSRDATRRALSREINDLLVENDQLGEKLVDALLSDEIISEAIKERIKKNKKKIGVLDNEMTEVAYDKDDFVLRMSDLISDIQKFPSLYLASNFEEKAKLLRSRISSIIVDDISRTVELIWEKPFTFILNPGVMSYADTPAEVRKCPTMLPESDTLRTLIDPIALVARRWFSRVA